MTSMALLLSPVSKEARALTVPSLACLVCMVVASVLDAPYLLGGISVPAYFLGAAALGALSIGHEYTGRTLSLLLSMPVRRERLLAVKLGVLAAMLLMLWVVAHTLVFGDSRLPQTAKQAAALLPALCGLLLAPWLTMACRSAIGGAVFTLAIPGTLLVLGELTGVALHGHGRVMEAFRLAFVWYTTLGLCAIGAVMSWRMFMRLEVIEGSGQHLRIPQWLQSRSAANTAAPQLTRYHPIWLLVRKELHLQQLPLVLAALFVLGWVVGVWATARVSDSAYGSSFEALTFLYAGLLPMLIGSSASAAEREIGTLEWQVLQPIAVSKQWAIKVGVVLGLSIALALGMPTLLTSIRTELSMVMVIVLLATGSLYVSSVCTSALWALVMSISAIPGFFIFLNFVIGRLGTRLYFRAPAGLTLVLIAGFIAVLLWFALTNHRSADRAPARTWKQVTLMAAYVTASVITLAATNGH